MPSSRQSPLNVLARLAAPSPVPLIMGVVNATPDSFYGGSRTMDPRAAADRGLRLEAEGADLLDVGGQSTRPGSEPVSEAEELDRVIPVIAELSRRASIPISVDTDKAAVAREALRAGASVVNDVSALRDPDMAAVAARAEAVILMHMKGTPRTMQEEPRYGDVVKEVMEFLIERRDQFLRAGGDVSRALLDPGIGFGKSLDHNLALLKNLRVFSDAGPVVVGVSRKSFLGRIMSGGAEPLAGPESRLEGSLAVACWAALQGARMLRVHDVAETRRALEALAAARDGRLCAGDR